MTKTLRGQGGHSQDPAYYLVHVGGGLIWAALGGVITFGGVKMKSMGSYGLAMTASIIAMLPCYPCFWLGLLIGIWSVMVLTKDEVKAAFR